MNQITGKVPLLPVVMWQKMLSVAPACLVSVLLLISISCKISSTLLFVNTRYLLVFPHELKAATFSMEVIVKQEQINADIPATMAGNVETPPRSSILAFSVKQEPEDEEVFLEPPAVEGNWQDFHGFTTEFEIKQEQVQTDVDEIRTGGTSQTVIEFSSMVSTAREVQEEEEMEVKPSVTTSGDAGELVCLGNRSSSPQLMSFPEIMRHQCESCVEGFTTAAALKCHLKSHVSSRIHRCERCSMEFGCKVRLLKHMSIHTGRKAFQCGTCGSSFRRPNDLKRHFARHSSDKPYVCEQCGNCFKSRSSLKVHLRAHVGDRPYRCDVCNMGFKQHSSLIQHKIVHTGERPYICEWCGAGLKTSSSLKRHLMIHTGEKLYHCEYCSLSFRQKSSLDVHLRTHTGEKPHKCEKCGAAFSQSSNLKTHLKTHTGEKPYKCDRCKRAFLCPSSLRIHLVTHTAERDYKCKLCPSTFNRRSNLKRHMNGHTDMDTHNNSGPDNFAENAANHTTIL